MSTRVLLLALVALCLAVARTAACMEPRPEETWDWVPASGAEPARAWIPATSRPDLVLTMAFPADLGCYSATLALYDDTGRVLPTGELGVIADEERFVLSASPPGDLGVYVVPPPVFHALKRSSTLRLTTADAEYGFSLAGSAAAINSVWKACEAKVDALKASGGYAGVNARVSPVHKALADGISGVEGESGPEDGAADRTSGGLPVSWTLLRRGVISLIALVFAVGNAFLVLDLVAKAFSLPAVSLLARREWHHGVLLAGAAGWILIPLAVYATYGLMAAGVAVVGYLTAGLMIATMLKPTVMQYAAASLIDWARELRLRGKGLSRGSRLIVEGYRRVARRQAVAPTEKTTDADILTVFERVGSAFKSVADQRGERLTGARINHIVWKFLQAREELSSDAFDAYLEQELRSYRKEGLAASYRQELHF